MTQLERLNKTVPYSITKGSEGESEVKRNKNLAGAFFSIFFLCQFSANAMDLDWSGQFRTESQLIYNYSMGNGATTDPADPRVVATQNNQAGYFIPGGGSRNAFFQDMFLRLRPVVIVNDNIYIKSEWWVGDPIYSLYGSGAPGTVDERQFYTTASKGSLITAQRVWGEFQSDLGTIQAGRMPLNWGLGIVWNSGNDVYDRYFSTGDGVRLAAKFGSFTLAPALIKYNTGSNVGGACPGGTNCNLSTASATGTTATGGAAVEDISISLKYENPDENMEMGVNFIRRLSGGAQGANSGALGVEGAAAGASYNTWDVYAKKTIGGATFGIEVPITNGTVGASKYKTFAVALESQVKLSDAWNLNAKAGYAPGQPDLTGTTADNYKAFYFHPAYRIGLIMFNYQLANFAGPNTQNDPVNANGTKLASPYDNPIVNAKYIALGGGFKADKWNFHTNFVFAKAGEVAGNNVKFFNTWTHSFQTRNANTPAQSNSLGWEMDYGTTFRWDDNFRFDFDLGWYFPGDYYKFSNVAAQNSTSSVFAMVLKAGVSF